MDIAYPESHKSREELNAGRLDDLVTASDAGQVNEGRLDNTGLALESLDNTLGESNKMVSFDDRCHLIIGLRILT